MRRNVFGVLTIVLATFIVAFSLFDGNKFVDCKGSRSSSRCVYFGDILCLIFCFLEAALALEVLHSLVHEAHRLHLTAAGQAMVRRRLAAEVGMMVSAKCNCTIKKF